MRPGKSCPVSLYFLDPFGKETPESLIGKIKIPFVYLKYGGTQTAQNSTACLLSAYPMNYNALQIPKKDSDSTWISQNPIWWPSNLKETVHQPKAMGLRGFSVSEHIKMKKMRIVGALRTNPHWEIEPEENESPCWRCKPEISKIRELIANPSAIYPSAIFFGLNPSTSTFRYHRWS